MVNLDYDNHLEVHLRQNKKDPPPSDNGFRFIATTVISVPIALELIGAIDVFPGNVEIVLPPPSVEIPQSPQRLPNLPDTGVRSPQPTPFATTNNSPNPEISTVGGGGSWTGDVQISYCNGYFASANFRDYADYDPIAISGKVPPGDWVTLTGRTYFEDGILWYEAINYSPLEPSEDGYDYYYQPQANQVGWIASCFVE